MRGVSIDTSMGFTPASGLVMSTRSGDLDPGLGSFLAHAEQMTATQFHHMVNHESGLLGVSEISSDMRQLLAREAVDVRAADAVALFCYQARKWIGAFAAALGGLDTLVFTAGIGERSAAIRTRICQGLGFLGIELHDERNAANADVISADASRVTVRVIRTDEEVMIARSVFEVLARRDTSRNMNHEGTNPHRLRPNWFAGSTPTGARPIICRSDRSISRQSAAEEAADAATRQAAPARPLGHDAGAELSFTST